MLKKTEADNKLDNVKSPINWIMKNCPQAVIKSLDDCMEPKESSTEENPDWQIDFGLLTRSHKMFKNEIVKGKTKLSALNRKELADQSLLLKVQEYQGRGDESFQSGATEFLKHPVTQLYVKKRWDEAKWIFYIVVMLMHFIYSCTFSLFAVLVFHDICPLSQDENYYSEKQVKLLHSSTWEFWDKIECTGLRTKGNNFTENADDWQFTMDANWALAAWVCLIIFTTIVILREVSDFIDQGRQNLKEIDTICHIFMVVMVAICLWQNTPFDGTMSVSKYQHHAAVWGCFTCWIQMSLYMERLPKFGIYLLMLRKVARTFMKLAWSYTSLIFAFGCAFYLVFPSQYYFQNDLPSVFVKVFKINQIV